MLVESITKKLAKFPIKEISDRFQFNLRKDAKITLLNLVSGFFLSLSTVHSLREWSNQITGMLKAGVSVTKAGLQKRLGNRQLESVKALLGEVLRSQLQGMHEQETQAGWFSPFNRVLLEDSSCVSVHRALSKHFPGSYSKSGDNATARIQLCMELKSMTYERLALMSFRDNDQKYSKEILPHLESGDLVIRDLGYSVLDVFAVIIRKEAFFLSRYKVGVALYESKDEAALDLAKWLGRCHQRGECQVDRNLFMGAQQKLPVRLVALRCPDEVAAERVRKAKQDRHAKANHSKAYYELLKWTIFLTNVPPEVWRPQTVWKVYGFRWHIEMIFKVWKSKFGLQRLMDRNAIEKPIHAQIFFYLFLTYLILFYVGYFRFFLAKIFQAKQKILSPFQFADFIRGHLAQLLESEQNGQLLQWCLPLERGYCYDKRKARRPQLEEIIIYGGLAEIQPTNPLI
jgi:hypothetical protein